jgi:hypothetical protein
MILRLLAGALLCVLFASNADARPRQRTTADSPQMSGNVRQPLMARNGLKSIIGDSGGGCSDPVMRPCGGEGAQSRNLNRMLRVERRPMPPGLRRVMAEGAGRVIGGRPAGCPRRYCGCGASLYLFGKIIPSLNLAANWLRFPRAAPAPGMVGARRGHVFVLKRHIRGKVWMVHDSNSGRGKTRVHPRSIAGFQTVDPRGV